MTHSDPDALNSLAWTRVSPDPAERIWGDEALGLTYALEAMKLATSEGARD